MYWCDTSKRLCMPLMEFMSAGVPAIAPDHTAMADYITTDNAFIVRGTREHNVWPHDPEQMFRTMRYRIEWDSIVEAFEDAAAMLNGPAERRVAMSNAARAPKCSRVFQTAGRPRRTRRRAWRR